MPVGLAAGKAIDMTTRGLIQSRRRARPAQPSTIGLAAGSPLASARAAGVLYLVIIACGIFAEVVVRSRLIIDGDAQATAANILESEWLFRIGFAADLIVLLSDVAIAIVLFFLFRPVSRVVSALAAAFRLTQTAIIGLNLLSMFGALLILREADYLRLFGEDGSEALALLLLDLHKHGYTLGLTFFALSTLAIAYLALRSRVVPRLLVVLLGLAGVGYLADSFAFFLVPGYDGSISPVLLAPALAGELWFALWLLLKGRRLEEQAIATEGAR
jgi:Domain of unknown function (DUF4386)